MSSDLILDASAIGKCYQVYERPSHRLLQGLVGSGRKLYREFWALRDINLRIRRGETLGIIGRNGSGKSTLLQIIAGTLMPTEGRIAVHGRIAALLELGSGFNPDFTGRENVYLNAAILGLSRTQIDQRMEDILAFAGIGEFVDQPIRSYSSGMVMRLAFAVMAHVDADVLIIDEALAVGDAFFTQKCMRFLREFKQRGTLLFVSHDGAAVAGLCDNALWLDSGGARAYGSAKDIVQAYLQSMIAERQDGDIREIASEAPVAPRERYDSRRDFVNTSNLRNDIEVIAFDPSAPGFGEQGAIVLDVALRDAGSGRELAWVVGGESVELLVTARAERNLQKPIVGFYLKDALGQNLFGDNTYLTTLDAPVPVRAGREFRASFRFEMPRLRSGDYFVTVGVADGGREEHDVQHWIHEALLLHSRCEAWSIGILGIPMHSIRIEEIE